MINVEPEKIRLAKLRELLRQMSDEQLIEFRRELRKIPKRVSGVPDIDQLAEARTGWRRRHPKTIS